MTRTCKHCGRGFSSPADLDFCNQVCVDTYFKEATDALRVRKEVQSSLLLHAVFCRGCGVAIDPFTKAGVARHFCSSACSCSFNNRTSAKSKLVQRKCSVCDVKVVCAFNIADSYVRCSLHQAKWPEIQKASDLGKKTVTPALTPYDQYFLKGPWWDYKKRTWSVLLMHSGASPKREMEYARYLLSVKEGKRIGDDSVITYKDGDRSNIEITNLAVS